jgi:hypothetical protein
MSLGLRESLVSTSARNFLHPNCANSVLKPTCIGPLSIFNRYSGMGSRLSTRYVDASSCCLGLMGMSEISTIYVLHSSLGWDVSDYREMLERDTGQ